MKLVRAQQICQLAEQCFGNQVEARAISKRGPGPRGHAADLYHKRLQRRVSIVDVDDWPPLRECWQAATLD